jgi:hypothetical protein
MCPYYLDGDRTLRKRGSGSVILVVRRAYRHGETLATVQFSRAAGRRPAGLAGPVSQNSTACAS